MGFFDQFHKKGPAALQPQQAAVRKEVVRAVHRPVSVRAATPLALKLASAGRPAARGPRSRSATPSTATSTTSPEPASKHSRARKRRVIEAPRLESSDEDEDEDEDARPDSKRPKRHHDADDETTVRRSIRAPSAFDPKSEPFPYVHAADIASLKQQGKFTAAFEGAAEAPAAVELQYPSASPRERYELVQPRDQEDFRPLQDIIQVTEHVAGSYLTEAQAELILDESGGLQRRLKRAVAHRSAKAFAEAVGEYNEYVQKLLDQGTLAENLDRRHSLSLPLVEHILTQTYARTVSLKVDSLRKYENGTDNVYGELLPRFISKIFHDTKLRSDQVFVDLGSGVANVVLQAALEVGCESWGCEMMDNACDLAELQEREFAARCRLWGLAPGRVQLERGDFLINAQMAKALPRADVVLVNNQAFTPALNQGLVNLFLDLKEGCQIVSLKSFVPSDHKISSRNFNSPVNLLEVETKAYYSNCVSWTNAPGTYCIARKDGRRLQSFARRMQS